eukprot:GHRR01034983.1.p1 GENE.GHRR01034983.1~~GHRR01034983.1.p1  ORF type:complete len:100 (-),score=30.15 GHRR01034983.1:613-912(-)
MPAKAPACLAAQNFCSYKGARHAVQLTALLVPGSQLVCSATLQFLCLMLRMGDMQAQARYGNNWKAISMMLPGRTNRAVKNLFVGNLKWGARLPEIKNR